MSAGQPKAQTFPPPPSCKWCDAPLTSADYQEDVCIRCYALLSGAGISDDEIFFRRDLEEQRALRKPQRDIHTSVS